MISSEECDLVTKKGDGLCFSPVFTHVVSTYCFSASSLFLGIQFFTNESSNWLASFRFAIPASFYESTMCGLERKKNTV